MAKKPAKRIGDVFNYADHMARYVKVDEVLSVPLTLISFVTTRGNMGEYAIMSCVKNGTGETIEVSCGAVMVMKALQTIHPGDLPIEFQFEQLGRAYVMADTDQPAE